MGKESIKARINQLEEWLKTTPKYKREKELQNKNRRSRR